MKAEVANRVRKAKLKIGNHDYCDLAKAKSEYDECPLIHNANALDGLLTLASTICCHRNKAATLRDYGHLS